MLNAYINTPQFMLHAGKVYLTIDTAIIRIEIISDGWTYLIIHYQGLQFFVFFQ